MAPELDDAWTRLPPLDRLIDVLNAPSGTPPVEPRRTVRFSMYLKGTEAIFVAEGDDDEIEVKFRYRRKAGAWQMFRREGSRWIAESPPSDRAGRLLEQIVAVMHGADPTAVF